MARQTRLKLVLTCALVLIGTSARAGNFPVLSFYDPFTLDSLVEDIDTVFQHLADFGTDYLVAQGQSIVTEYAQTHGFDIVVANAALQRRPTGHWTTWHYKINVIDDWPHNWEDLIAYSYRQEYFATNTDKTQQYTYDASRTGDEWQQDGYWWADNAQHDSGFVLTDFVEYTSTNYLGKPLILMTCPHELYHFLS